MDIKDKVALVTGAGSGMGAETAGALSKAGARVVLMDINQEAIQSLAATINAYPLSCDITDSASVEAAFELMNAEWGVPQILVNCAGIVYGRKVVSSKGVMSLEAFKKVIDVNVIGTFNTLRLAAAGMMSLPAENETGERGVIINTASIAAYEGQIGQSAYSASKGAIVAMTLPSAREFASAGIRVMTIAPGLIDTPMMASLPEAAKLHLEKDQVFPRRLGRPEEFSDMVLHIIRNVLLNGETIRLDGAVRLSQ